VAEVWDRLLRLRRAQALLYPPVQRYPFADARRALRAIADCQATGKVVLSRQTRLIRRVLLTNRQPTGSPLARLSWPQGKDHFCQDST
jgi:hypothetical protein